MILRAKVVTNLRRTRHSIGTIDHGVPVPKEIIPTPNWVEIHPLENAYFLFHYNQDGVCIADTWHETLDDAKEQAAFEFGITDPEWEEVEHNE